MAKVIIAVGVALVVVGCIWLLVDRWLPLGRLPGDIVWKGERTTVFFPIVTCIIVSIVLSIVVSLLRRL
ncbi:DUF2905 domain-containing protein [Bacillus sp. FSL W7-1360]